jgi:hypothetical protein
MARLSISVHVAVAVGIVLAAAPATLRAQAATTAGVSLKISKESAPPGGLVQMKVFVTEPKPISTAFADVSLGDFSDVAGIAVDSPSHDALGVAVVSGSRLRISILSPSTTFGTAPDYPVLTFAGRVSPTAPLGEVFPIDMDPASIEFRDPGGAVYPSSFNPGSVLVAAGVGIEDVTPGSGTVGVGDVVTLVGRSFSRGTKVKVKEAILSAVSFVDPEHLQLTFATAIRLHGAGIDAANPDGTRSKYFSYQRTYRQAASLEPTLHDAVPVFADLAVTGATVDIVGHSTGLALQNRDAGTVTVTCELVSASGAATARRTVTLQPRRFLLLDLMELFGVPYSTSQSVRVRSQAPIQVMGVAVDAAGGATPIPAR